MLCQSNFFYAKGNEFLRLATHNRTGALIRATQYDQCKSSKHSYGAFSDFIGQHQATLTSDECLCKCCT